MKELVKIVVFVPEENADEVREEVVIDIYAMLSL
jgi:hypothetical protein